jgi:hypothetical protein
MIPPQDDTVLVVGMGDLGRRVVEALSEHPVARLVAAGRDLREASAVAGQAALVAALADGPRTVEPARIDLEDVDATAAELARLRPSVIVLAASRVTWWRLPERAAAVPYGAWLPLQLQLVRRLMEARAATGLDAPVVALPYPDAVGPVLAGAGLAPQLGAGNVLEMAAKLTALAAARAEVRREAVEVRLVAHHATERLAFSAFGALAGGGGPPGPPPVLAQVLVDGSPLAEDTVRADLTAPYPLPAGRASHRLTAAATAATVAALLSDVPRRLHAPAPGGRPGGYPVRISRAGVELDLPDGLAEEDAVAVNAVAGRWDGIEAIAPDGTVTFGAWLSDALHAALGLRLQRVAPSEQEAVAEELLARLER